MGLGVDVRVWGRGGDESPRTDRARAARSTGRLTARSSRAPVTAGNVSEGPVQAWPIEVLVATDPCVALCAFLRLVVSVVRTLRH